MWEWVLRVNDVTGAQPQLWQEMKEPIREEEEEEEEQEKALVKYPRLRPTEITRWLVLKPVAKKLQWSIFPWNSITKKCVCR